MGPLAHHLRAAGAVCVWRRRHPAAHRLALVPPVHNTSGGRTRGAGSPDRPGGAPPSAHPAGRRGPAGGRFLRLPHRPHALGRRLPHRPHHRLARRSAAPDAFVASAAGRVAAQPRLAPRAALCRVAGRHAALSPAQPAGRRRLPGRAAPALQRHAPSPALADLRPAGKPRPDPTLLRLCRKLQLRGRGRSRLSVAGPRGRPREASPLASRDGPRPHQRHPPQHHRPRAQSACPRLGIDAGGARGGKQTGPPNRLSGHRTDCRADSRWLGAHPDHHGIRRPRHNRPADD